MPFDFMPLAKLYSFKEILSATNNFSDENLIMKGPAGSVYNGIFFRNGFSINCVRRLCCKYKIGDVIRREVSMLQTLSHKNISSILGYCDENGEAILIYPQSLNKTLDRHLRNPALTWCQRLQICLGVARGLNHIQYNVIHCDINSSKIFLDEKWEPRIYGFELSTEHPQSWRHRLLFSSYFDVNHLTPKYDVYSFGVLLLEVLCGRKPMITNDSVEEEPEEIIDPNLRNQMDEDSLRLFKDLAYKCLSQQLVQRPKMNQIVEKLEEVLELQWKHADVKERSKAADEGIPSNNVKMDPFKISLSEIKHATNNFDEAYVVGSGGYGKVYKAKLNVVNFQKLSSPEEKSGDELPKISKTVAIKRIFGRADEQGKQGFLTEIELLTSCKHPNIVSLLGFSREAREMILVYEYAFNGSLSDHLVGTSGQAVNLTWAQRLQICLDIAQGINYLHTNMDGKPRIIHRDIKSDNILLDENLNAKLADFGLSKFHPTNHEASTIYTKNIAGTEVYMDPEFLSTGKYKRESDIYSFGVVLFEVLSGSMAYDLVYTNENVKGLAPIARRHYNEETLKELVDPKIAEDHDHIFSLHRGPNQDSFDTFSKIAYQCLAETQAKRPPMTIVINELQKALQLQGETTVLSRFRLSEIVLATDNFAETYKVGLHTNGMVYIAELLQYDNNGSVVTEGEHNGEPSKKHITVAIKRFTDKQKEGFFEELEMHVSYKHPNIVSLLGLCVEGDEMILVYEHASNQSLDDYLKTTDNMEDFTWSNRLRICVQLGHGLDHLNTQMVSPHRKMCRDIKSANILLGNDWEVKIAYPGIYKLQPANDQDPGMKMYEHPEHEAADKSKEEWDNYSFGVVLSEIYCGRVADDPIYIRENDEGLAPVAIQHCSDGKMGEIISRMFVETFSSEGVRSAKGSTISFVHIVYKFLTEASNHVSMQWVIDKLNKAVDRLMFPPEGETTVLTRFRLSEIVLATENFAETYYIGLDTNGMVYKAQLYDSGSNSLLVSEGKHNGEPSDKRITVAIKRFTDNKGKGFFEELKVHTSYKHPNIVLLLGYCVEGDEMILVYEDASNQSLDDYLKTTDNMDDFTLLNRLRICVQLGQALSHLNARIVSPQRKICRVIRSANILLGNDWDVKIAYPGIYRLQPANDQEVSMKVYEDPEYETTTVASPLNKIFCGRVAYDPVYTRENDNGLASGDRRLKEIVSRMMEEIFSSEGTRAAKGSTMSCIRMVYRCLREAPTRSPMAWVIDELNSTFALLKFTLQEETTLHEETTVLTRFRLNEIVLATENFAETYYIGLDTNGMVYKAELYHSGSDSSLVTEGKYTSEPPKKRITAAIKRFTNNQGKEGLFAEFFAEFEMYASYKHPNIVSLIGYCVEGDEMILVYEDAFNQSLDDYLKTADNMDDFTWSNRLRVCVQIARGLTYLHTRLFSSKRKMCRDIKSANILLGNNWEVKIAYPGIYKLERANDQAVGMKVYEDPEYETTASNSVRECDIYSFGVVLSEIFCGRVAYDPIYTRENDNGLALIALQRFNDGSIEEIINPRLKKTFTSDKVPDVDSLLSFFNIVYQCSRESSNRLPMVRVESALDTLEEKSKRLISQEQVRNRQPSQMSFTKALSGVIAAQMSFTKALSGVIAARSRIQGNRKRKR